jgi:hypothetical protein
LANNGQDAALISARTMVVLEKKGNVNALFFHPDGAVLLMSFKDGLSLAHRGNKDKD